MIKLVNVVFIVSILTQKAINGISVGTGSDIKTSLIELLDTHIGIDNFYIVYINISYSFIGY